MRDIAAEIETLLAKLPFVQWDRFTHTTDLDEVYNLYGWIDRDKDAYKDFVLLRYWPEDEQWTMFTSSSLRSKEIGELLGAAPDDHDDCERVEMIVSKDFKNVIRLAPYH